MSAVQVYDIDSGEWYVWLKQQSPLPEQSVIEPLIDTAGSRLRQEVMFPDRALRSAQA